MSDNPARWSQSNPTARASHHDGNARQSLAERIGIAALCEAVKVSLASDSKRATTRKSFSRNPEFVMPILDDLVMKLPGQVPGTWASGR